MSSALLIARLVLAAVLAAAAFGKLADLDGSRRTVERFGLSPRFARPAGLLLPLTELAIAFGLLFVDTALWAAVAAVVLLLVFCLAIGRVLVRGEAPECNCFGSLGSAPVGRGTLVRNGALIAVAGFVVVAGWNGAGTSAFAWVGESTALATVAGVFAVAVGLQAVFSWQLFKQNGRLLARVTDLEEAAGSGGTAHSGLAVGEPGPDFALPDLDGRLVGLDDLRAPGRGLLLFFTDPGCGHCSPVLPAVAAAQADGSGVSVAVISTGEVAANRTRADEHGIGQVLLQEGFEVAEQYRVFGAPGAVLLDAAGRVASERIEGAAAVGELLAAISPPRARLSSVPDHRTDAYVEAGAL